MTKEKGIPQIRFSGFTDTWEQRKLGDTVQITMGQSPDGSTYSDVPSDYILVQGNADLQNGWVSPRVWTSQMTKKADAGDLIMSVRAPAGAMGKTAYNAVIGRGVAAIKGNEFIYQLLEKMDSDGYWKALSCGSTFESLNSDNIKNADVLIPDVAEQEKIGEYFLAIDRLITLHQRKYDKLTKVKKAMLEKMFPENGSPYPEIRFKGFTDAWEQHKLGDHSEIVAGGTPNTGHPEYWNPKEIPWMSSGEINNKVIYSTDNMISKIGFSNSSAKWVKEKSVLIALAGQGKTRGTVAISEIPLTTNQSIAAIQPDSFLYYKFLFQNLEERYNELREVSSGDGTRGGLNKQIISDLEVLAPEIQEQIKIGDFLCGIDTLITLHQRKLEKLKNIKKACLEKMFV